MVEINDKAIEQYVFFPKSTESDLEKYDLTLVSELMQKTYSFSGLTNESKSKNYFKFKMDFSQVDNAEYNYSISDISTGLIRIGEIEENLPDTMAYKPFIDAETGNEIIEYYPYGNFKYKFQTDKIVEIVENGVVNVTPDSGYTALLNAEIHVNVPTTGHTDEELEDAYNSGVTVGVEEQKSKLTSTAVTENGIYTKEDGYNSVSVNVPVEDYYNSGKTDGITEQKAKLISTAVTSNGTYTRTDGFNSVNVNVPVEDYYSSGYTSGKTDGVAEQKAKLVSTAVTENGTYSRTDGYSSITVNVPQTGHTDEEIAQAYNSGATFQKSLLVSTAVTSNGVYQRENGFNLITVNVPTGSTINNQTKTVTVSVNGSSAITFDNGYTGLEKVNLNVNIPQTGHTDEELQQAYNSGVTVGVEEQKAKLISTAVTENGTYTRTDGYNSINVNVPVEDYYNSGKTDGIAEQKAKLVSTAITSNGTYTRTDGYNSVSVNVPDRFQEGYTSGYTDGYEAGFESGSSVIKYYTLTVDVISDTASASSGLVGNAVVVVNYGSSSLTQTYQGTALEFKLNPGVNYTVTFGGVTDFTAPSSQTGTTTWNGSESISGIYTYIDPTIPYDEQYFTIEIISGETENITLSFQTVQSYLEIPIQVSINNSEWINKNFGGSNNSLSGLTVNDKIRVRGTNETYTYSSLPSYFYSTSNITVNVYGNIMSLFYGNDFINKKTFPTNRPNILRSFFVNRNSDSNNKLKFLNAGNLILPATALTESCYSYMFANCSNLVTAPKLPATTLANSCYEGMFNNCTSLVNTHELPATVLAESCYQGMFNGCTSLVNAPALPATALTSSCYFSMFYNCSSLVNAPALPATTLASDCYRSMFLGCTSLVSAPALPATTLADKCYYTMFQGCTSLVSAPELPATTLTNYCYSNMFNGCTSLVSAPELPATTLTNYCYQDMFRNCTLLKYIKCLATDISTTYCTYNWVNNVSTSGTFVKNPLMESWTTGVNGIPLGWDVENTQ